MREKQRQRYNHIKDEHSRWLTYTILIDPKYTKEI